MTTELHSEWVKPRTDTAAFQRAAAVARRLDLDINIASTPHCAARHGRFWVHDLSLGERAGSAETLEGVLDILTKYEAQRPAGKPEPEPWLPRKLRGWRPW